MPQPEPEPQPEPKPQPKPEPLPEPVKPTEPQIKGDPFKVKWPAYQPAKPKPAQPGRAVDYFNEHFDNPRYDWRWLPSGVKHVPGSPGKTGVLELGANRSFQLQGNVETGEVRLSVWREMTDADRNAMGADAKGYEVQFRYSGASSYCALQLRCDGYYRLIKVSGGKTTTLIGDSKGDYLPLPGWDRGADLDEVLLVFRGGNVTGTFNGRPLSSTDQAGEGSGKIGVRTLNGLSIEIEKFSVDE
jgi:hypothetical protein